LRPKAAHFQYLAEIDSDSGRLSENDRTKQLKQSAKSAGKVLVLQLGVSVEPSPPARFDQQYRAMVFIG